MTYYCALIAISIYYLVVSCYPVLPWTACQDTDQSDKICIPSSENKSDYVQCHERTCYTSNTTGVNGTICGQAGLDINQMNWSTIDQAGFDIDQMNWTVKNDSLCVQAGTNIIELNWNTNTSLTTVSSAEQYFYNGVLKLKSDISSGLGLPDPALAGCLAVCWILLYLTLRKVEIFEANIFLLIETIILILISFKYLGRDRAAVARWPTSRPCSPTW